MLNRGGREGDGDMRTATKKGHILSSTIVVELTLVITSVSYESMHLHSQEFYTWMKFLWIIV